jgi:hypothetical protein
MFRTWRGEGKSTREDLELSPGKEYGLKENLA